MKKYHIIQQIMALILAIVLFAPTALAGGGGKQFKKGRKFEAAQQWDLAAEQYALALSEDPGNPEYKLHFLRALANASLSLMERGKVLAEQGDYEGAYQAFRQAYSYDNTNEMALSRMRLMLEKLGIDNKDNSLNSNPNDLKKTSLGANPPTKDVALATTKFRKADFDFSSEASVMTIINTIASQCGQKGLNIVYEDNIAKLVETKKTRFVLRDVTAPKALDIFFNTQRLSYAQLDRRTILVFTDALANRQKYEDLYVRTFYIKNSVLDDAAKVLQQAVGSKQIIPIKNLNALVVRDTKENLALIETLLERVDKAQSEVVLDVNLYEVNDRSMLQIGNQFDAGILANLGSFAGGDGLRRSTLPGVFSGLDSGLVAPSSLLSFVQSKTIGKLVASTQIRAFENEAGEVNIGSRVPIRSATIPTGNVVTSGLGQNGQPTQTSQSVLGGIGGVEQITYENVGLNIQLTPQVLNDYVQMKLSIESSSVVQEAQASRRTQTSNPTFNQRKVKGVARIKEGETGIVASVMRIDKSEGAAGIPILSFIPIAGRFFATPKNDSMATNIVITITPHVLRAPYVGESDYKTIGPNGNATSFGVAPTLEEIVARANYEDQVENQNEGQINSQGLQQSSAPTTQATPGLIAPTKNQTQPINNSTIKPNQPPNELPPNPLPNPLPNSSPNYQNPNPPPAPPETGSSNFDNNSLTSEDLNQANLSPVTVLARVLNPQIVISQVGLVGIVFNSNNIQVSEANIALRFNPSVIKLKSVQDGGLMSLNGVRAEFNFSDLGDIVNINIRRPSNATPVPASGQVALLYFEGVGQGSADINISEAQLLGPNAQTLPITLVNSNIEVQKAQGNGGNDNGDDGDDDEDDE